MINQSNAVFGDAQLNLIQLFLSYLTPFAIISLSQALGIRVALADATMGRFPSSYSFLATVRSHGILRRAIVIALIVGTILAIISSVPALLRGFGLNWGLMVQLYLIPLLFSTTSQTIAYNRAIIAARQRIGSLKK
jgi:hypothetical protein